MIEKFFPFVGWYRLLDASTVRQDIISGLTVALVLIPQSMAYAQLAGLPVYYGLYASFLPPMVAALFGSSRQLATGPVAVVSLMTSASLEPLATAGSAGYIQYAILLAFMVGLFQFSLGVMRLGIVVNFISHPVVNGFTNAAAIIIASSQLSKMFGVTVDQAEHHYETIIRVCEAAYHFTHWPTFILGMLAFLIMYTMKKFTPRAPNVLVAVFVITVISWAIGFECKEKIVIDQIQSPDVREVLVSYNSIIDERDTLVSRRKEENDRLDHLPEQSPALQRLEIQHQIDIINVRLAEIGDRLSELRSRVREFYFLRFEGNDGMTSFVLDSHESVEKPLDDRLWRVRITNSQIEPAGIVMNAGGAVVGTVPKGLPDFALPTFEPNIILRLLPFAAIISLLGFMEAVSIAKAMAAKTGQRLDPNQELIGQGMANILGSFSRSFPTSGSFSRSAVNLQSGAVTGLSSVITSVTVIIVLFFFTPLLYHLPQSVLAAVIMMAVVGLINVSGFVHAWQAQWYDGAISIITFIFTLAFAPHLDRGIFVGVSLSLAVFLYKSMRPSVPSLARLEDESMRSAAVHGLMECHYIDIMRFDSPLFFANASYLEDKINERMRTKGLLQHIILVCNGINDMDASGEEVLSLLIDTVRSTNVEISLSGVNELVMGVLVRTHLIDKIGRENIYPTLEKAICAVHPKTHRGSTEERCPLTTVCRLD